MPISASATLPPFLSALSSLSYYRRYYNNTSFFHQKDLAALFDPVEEVFFRTKHGGYKRKAKIINTHDQASDGFIDRLVT